MEEFVCLVCGCRDKKYIGIKAGHPYCRRCISFRGEEVVDDISYPTRAPIYIDYELSDDQKKLSSQLVENYKSGINSLVHAVCGSGKTEIVLEVIQYAINCGDKVGFAIPRRDVVIELSKRFEAIFKQNSVISIYGGHTNNKSGDLVLLTTHQLFRYYHYFDLLIMDEIDAFPFKNNEILKAFFYRAIKNKFILMSATPNEGLIEAFKKEGYQLLELYSRFHTYPLPVPKMIIKNKISLFFHLVDYIKKFVANSKPVMVFVPTIEMSEETYALVSLFIKGGMPVHSKRKDREKIIDGFMKGQYKYLITTAVLERGVTVRNAQVIVYHAEHNIYNQYTLVQISGRVGRKKDAPTGEVIYLASKETEEMEKSIREIKRANKNLQNML
ncbi:MAG: DEAD/DEAH box helicase family protein [Bacilli bacterium]|nr:DEAD/DEAH box helicase family protein [Bacilli bacterium]